MPQNTQSQASYNRLEKFLRNLLNYYVDRSFQPNYAIDEASQDNITIKWMEKSADTAKLMVCGTLNDLLDFTDNRDAEYAADNLKHDLKVLEEKLQILEDLRHQSQGSKQWHFSLTLWSRYSIDKNLSEFQQLWELTKHNNQSSESPTSPPNNPEPVEGNHDDINKSSSPAPCIITGDYNIGHNFGIVINNPSPDNSARIAEQTKEILKMDILKNIQNMDKRLDLIHNALAPDFFLN
jgi:Effector-associated domain 4